MKETYKDLKEAVQFAKEVQKMNLDNTNNGGSIKMYASRKATSFKQWYLEDKETCEIMNLLQDAIQDAFDIKPSRTILIRHAMRSYSQKFIELMITGKLTDDVEKFVADLIAEKEAILAVKKY